MLDARANQIRADLEEAKALREEAQTILASYERKQKDVQAQADRIVAPPGKRPWRRPRRPRKTSRCRSPVGSPPREERIASPRRRRAAEVRERAVSVAVAAAGDLLAKQMTPETAAPWVDAAISQVDARLH